MNERLQILCTCPPMIRAMDDLRHEFARRGAEVVCPEFSQVMTVPELIDIVPRFDGWIIGDDPAVGDVFRAGRTGRLRAAVKWGVGIDNVDFSGARAAGFEHIPNTPGMFGEEVSDVAVGYLISLSRSLFSIDRGVRAGGWPKPAGMSLSGKTAALIGFGNIGRSTARKLLAFDLNLIVYDPGFRAASGIQVDISTWPDRIEQADILVLTCALTESSRHMINSRTLARMKAGIYIVNVGRGPLIDEIALVDSLRSGHVAGAALEVFEFEPLPLNSPLRGFDSCIFGSHNSSNTTEAVRRTSLKAIDLLFNQLESGS